MSDAHRRARARGMEAERRARDLFRALGYRVEIAPAVLRRIPGRATPITARHDYHGLWDLCFVDAEVRGFAQVTSQSNLAHRRRKILAAGWPAQPQDVILVHLMAWSFRVYHPPTYEATTTERWTLNRARGVVLKEAWSR